MPGINPITYPADLAGATADLAKNTASAPAVKAEPPLACYVTAGCARGGTASAGGSSTGGPSPKCTKHKKRHHQAAASKKRRGCKKHRKHRSRG
jgi:hypothetical protein